MFLKLFTSQSFNEGKLLVLMLNSEGQTKIEEVDLKG